MTELIPGFNDSVDEVIDFFGFPDRTMEAILYALRQMVPVTTSAEVLYKKICIHDLCLDDVLKDLSDAQLCADAVQNALFRDPEMFATALQAQDLLTAKLNIRMIRPSYIPIDKNKQVTRFGTIPT